MFKSERYYHTDFLGEARVTETCLYSPCNLIQTNANLSYALLTNDQSHALIIKDQSDRYHIIRSGYSGKGLKGLAKALKFLRKHRIKTKEVIVSSKLINNSMTHH